jgi:hypothetical protein
MGKMVSVKRSDLVAAGVEVRTVTHERVWYPYPEALPGEEGSDVCYHHQVPYLQALLEGKWVESYSPDTLAFDCRDEDSGNYWILQSLRERGVKYLWF